MTDPVRSGCAGPPSDSVADPPAPGLADPPSGSVPDLPGPVLADPPSGSVPDLPGPGLADPPSGSVPDPPVPGLAGPPAGPVRLPPGVATVVGDAPWRGVWRNQCGGLTIEITSTRARRFLKWAPRDSGLDLAAEAERLTWADRYTAVPRVLETGQDEDGSWLVLSALEGGSAVDERWRDEPAVAVRAIGRGLRALHDALPVDACPYTWAVEERIAVARRRSEEGRQRPGDWHPDHAALTVADALARVADPPPVDVEVVCHGDACAPNTIVTDDGRCSGHVDLAALGVADRWADLAVASWSTMWNYGTGYEDLLLEGYGVERDPDRIAYYRLLWDLT